LPALTPGTAGLPHTVTNNATQITDMCECDYPDNAYSNKRWCCGDMWVAAPALTSP